MMQHYELLFIIPGTTNDSEVPAIKEKVAAFIAKIGGEITLDQDYEKQKLAYKIKQETFGHYWLMEFNAESRNIAELSHQLELAPEILRFLILIKRIKSEEELAQEVRIQAKINERRADKVKKQLKKVTETENKMEEPKKEEEKTEGKVSMEDLDKKLDEILGDNIKV